MSIRRTATTTTVVLVLLAGACSSSRRTTTSPEVVQTHGAPPPASAWPAAMHDARHSGQSAAVGPRTGAVRWQRDLGGNVTPGPVIGIDGSIIVAANNGVLTALDPADGSTRWTFDAHDSYGNDLSTSAAVLADGTIAWPGPGSRVYGISATGQLRWQVQLDGFVLSPAVSNIPGRLYLVTMTGTTSAVDVAADGSTAAIAWSLRTGGGSYGSPALAPDGSIVTTSADEVVAVTDHGTDATIRWHTRLDAQIEVSPAVGPDGTVVIGDNGHRQFGLDSTDGRVRWTVARGDETYASSIVTPTGLAYYADHTATLYVVDVATGSLIRSTTTLATRPGRSSGIWTAAAVDSQGAAYYGTRSGHVFGVGADGHKLFDLDVGGTVDSYPALGADGSLYIGTSTGQLYAIDPG